MDIIDLVKEIGLKPFKTASTGGGEYHCSCPVCEGKDRFIVWPNQLQNKCIGRYWCRQCDINGDAIDFCRNFLGLSWDKAMNKLNLPIATPPHPRPKLTKKASPKFETVQDPSAAWKEKALFFVNQCHERLWENPHALKKLHERGFTNDSIKRFKLGYCCSHESTNTKDSYCDYADWDLAPEINDSGKLKRLWLPHGLVIPWISEKGVVLKINIRRFDWYEEEKFGKYIKVIGSKKTPAIYGDVNKRIALVLESELDAMLIQQEARDICFCIATGGTSQPIDSNTDYLISKSLLILICPDVDIAGAKFFQKLQEHYKHAKLWPASKGKSPGDALKDHNIDLRKWLLLGLPPALRPQNKTQAYEFTCDKCGSHDYWVSIFDKSCCIKCVDPLIDESLRRVSDLEPFGLAPASISQA